MLNSCSSDIRSRCVGIVDSVSPREIKGFLLDDAPTSVSIMEDNITFFPRINSYLVIPNETGWLVGIISWIGYNHANMNNEVNLPQGSRMIYLNTLGQIKKTLKEFKFERGAFTLPTVGDSILLPTLGQLSSIIANEDENSITIGTSSLAGNQEIKLSVDNLFGKHLAVLGNTGSGKSCTVSGIIRWSIEESLKKRGKSPNSRVIILDPNGEYRNTFNGLDIDVKYCAIKVDIGDIGVDQLRVPAWMWTSQEWAGILQASGKTQRPLLREALRDLKTTSIEEKIIDKSVINIDTIKLYIYSLECFLKESMSTQTFLNKSMSFGNNFNERIKDLKYAITEIGETEQVERNIIEAIKFMDNIITMHYAPFLGKSSGSQVEYYKPFSLEEICNSIIKIEEVFKISGKVEDSLRCNEDDPIEFELNNLAPYVNLLAQDSTAEQYIDFMTIRIKSLLRNIIISSVIGNMPKISLLDWINKYINNSEDKGKICILDLSIVPIEVVHLIVAVVSRLVFESLQRYRKYYGEELPTLLVMEEAHTFIKKYAESSDDSSSEKLCTQVFERIAREGRKFGLGLIISSQRPSELSPTVLSQCNSYILHRIVNDKDQEMVKRLVPDNLGNMLDELPALPTKKAIVLGAAVPVPILVDIKDLPEGKRPKSGDPKFWNVWIGKENRSLEWEPITDEWQKNRISYNKIENKEIQTIEYK